MLQRGTMRAVRLSGTLLCIASATAFGAMAAFGTLAYAAGASVGTLLTLRFAIAAALLWTLVLAGGGACQVRAIARRDVALAVALGAVVYAAQAGCYFAALARIDAALLSLLVYTFPAIVAIAAIALGRERADAGRLTALALASGGLALVLAGAGAGAVQPLGAGLGLGAAVVYSAYVLVGEPVAARVAPLPFAALVCSGAALSLAPATALAGDLHPGAVTIAGWGWLACIAAVSTVAAVALFFAGLRRVGATSASILATIEPLVTVVLASAAFGERLGRVQLAGGAVMLAGVLALGARGRSVPTDRRQVAACAR